MKRVFRQKDVLQDVVIFSKGVDKSILRSYLTKTQPEFHVCYAFLLIYQNLTDVSNTYETMQESKCRSDWHIFIQYGEVPDEMDIVINSSNVNIKCIKGIVGEVCKKHERNLKIM